MLTKSRVYAGCPGGLVRRLANLGDIPATYTHPTEKQCSYSYTHPANKVCNYSYTHPTTKQCDYSYTHPSYKVCNYNYVHPTEKQCNYAGMEAYTLISTTLTMTKSDPYASVVTRTVTVTLPRSILSRTIGLYCRFTLSEYNGFTSNSYAYINDKYYMLARSYGITCDEPLSVYLAREAIDKNVPHNSGNLGIYQSSTSLRFGHWCTGLSTAPNHYTLDFTANTTTSDFTCNLTATVDGSNSAYEVITNKGAIAIFVSAILV